MPTIAIKNSARGNSPAWQLLLDKHPFRDGGHGTRLPDQKIHHLTKVVSATRDARTHWGPVLRAKRAWLETLKKQYGDSFREVPMQNSSRLLLHLGRSSVLENVGLYAERITGLPIIPGTAVKGVLSTWACWEAHYNENTGEISTLGNGSEQRSQFGTTSNLAKRIFGDNSVRGSTSSAEVVFLGAFPQDSPKIELDIVTPHTDATGQDRSPVPNPILAIAPDTNWSFVFLAKPRDGSSPTPLLNKVEEWLKECLEQTGMGAKTAAGYGRFHAVQGQQTHETAQAPCSIGDYTEAEFRNSVLNRLGRPQEWQLLKQQINKLTENPANSDWIPKFIEGVQSMQRGRRKDLLGKDWFPLEWYSQQVKNQPQQ